MTAPTLHMWLTPRLYFYDEMISLLQKGIRRSNFEQALFASAEISASGKPGHVINRALIIFFEDIGYHKVETLTKVCQVIDRLDSLQKQCGGLAGELIKHPDFPPLLLELVRWLVKGSKIRISAHMSMFAFTQELPIPKLVMGTHEDHTMVHQLLSLSSGSHNEEVRQGFWRVACACRSTNERRILSELQHLYQFITEEWKASSKQHLPTTLLPPQSRLNTSKKVWKQPLSLLALLMYNYLIPSLQSAGEMVLYHCVDRERLEFSKATGESRLVLFTLALWIARGSALQEYAIKDVSETPVWYKAQLTPHSLTDEGEVSQRRIMTIDSSLIRDKHTRVGKGVNGLKWMTEFLVAYPSLQSVDLKKSHCEAVSPEQGTMSHFLKYCAIVEPESEVSNVYKEVGVSAYLELEEEKGTRGLKSSMMLKASTSSSSEEHWLTSPLGQIPTSKRKKAVYMTATHAIKGPYQPGTTLSLVKARTEVFTLLQTRVIILPSFRKTTKGEWLFFPQVATTPREEWLTEVRTAEVLGSFTVVVRESLGFVEGLVSMYRDPDRWVRDYFWSIFRDMLRMFLLRVGDVHMKNVLVTEEQAFIIDFEECSHRSLEGVPLETLFLYKDCANRDRETLQAGVKKYRKEIELEVLELEKLIPNIQERVDAIGVKYGVVFPNMLENLAEVRKRL